MNSGIEFRAAVNSNDSHFSRQSLDTAPMGASRDGERVGIPGSMALTGGEHLRLAIYPTLFVAYLTLLVPWFAVWDIAG
jgi:hypothetical protein